MITTSHFIIGGAVGVATGNPALALVAGIASHFVADMIPHFDVPPGAPRDKNDEVIMTPALWTQVWVDGVIGLAAVAALWIGRFDFPTLSPFVLGAFGGFLPDLIDNVPFWNDSFRATRFGKKFHHVHELTHSWKYRYPPEKYWLLGIVTQVVAIGLSLWYLL